MFDLKVIHSVLDQLEEERGIPQVKILVDETRVISEEEQLELEKEAEEKKNDIADEEEMDDRARFNPEHHIMLEDAKKIKKDAKLDEEIVFPLEQKEGYGRIAAQTAKQVIIQKIREAEKTSVLAEYGKRQGEIVSGTVQRIERGNLFIDLGRTSGMLPYEEQI